MKIIAPTAHKQPEPFVVSVTVFENEKGLRVEHRHVTEGVAPEGFQSWRSLGVLQLQTGPRETDVIAHQFWFGIETADSPADALNKIAAAYPAAAQEEYQRFIGERAAKSIIARG